jgi:hypothetical protein
MATFKGILSFDTEEFERKRQIAIEKYLAFQEAYNDLKKTKFTLFWQK